MCFVKLCVGQRMAEFVILAATAAIVSLPSRLLSVCLLRYLKDDHLRCGLSFCTMAQNYFCVRRQRRACRRLRLRRRFYAAKLDVHAAQVSPIVSRHQKQQSHTFLSHDLVIVESTTKALPVACLWAVWLSVCHISTVSRCVGASLMSLK